MEKQRVSFAGIAAISLGVLTGLYLFYSSKSSEEAEDEDKVARMLFDKADI